MTHDLTKHCERGGHIFKDLICLRCKLHDRQSCALDFGRNCPLEFKCWIDTKGGNLNPNRVSTLGSNNHLDAGRS